MVIVGWIGEGIEVVERGWTADDGRVSFGAIVENTTDGTLEPFAIYATAEDADGRPIEGLTELVLPAGALRPGEQVGLGDTVYGVDLPEIARLAFDSDEVGGEPVGTVTVSDIELTRGRLLTTVSFTMEASFDEMARMAAHVVIRDAGGAVVAGNRGRVLVGGRDREAAVGILADIVPDGATAEVYVVAA